MKEYPGGVFPVYKGRYFDATSWDGSEIFMPVDHLYGILGTERVKEALQQERARNVRWLRLADAITLPATVVPPE